MKFVHRAIMCLTVIGLTGAKKPELPVDPGPPPASLEEFQSKAQEAVIQGFFDPTSAQFEWDRGIVGGWFRPVFGPKIPGWWTCGLVNGRNRLGGYVGFRRFVAVMREGSIVYSQSGDASDFDVLTIQCNKAIQSGILPVAGATTNRAPDPDSPLFGLDITAVPDGAYIKTIRAGYPAEKAGLITGMVIEKLNGVSLRGFDTVTIGKMLKASTGEIDLTIIGRGDVKLSRATGVSH